VTSSFQSRGGSRSAPDIYQRLMGYRVLARRESTYLQNCETPCLCLVIMNTKSCCRGERPHQGSERWDECRGDGCGFGISGVRCLAVFGTRNFELRPQIPTALSAQLIADHPSHQLDLGLLWYVDSPPFKFSENFFLPLHSLLNGLYLNF